MKENNKEQDKINNSSYGNYEIKTEAVETLAKALKEGKIKEDNKTSTNSNEKTNPYHLDKISRIPSWLKILFVKFWVGGVICFFFLFGLGLYVKNILDLMVITGIATGIINDLLVNRAFLYFETDKKEYHKYLFLPIANKKLWTLLINIPLGLLEIYLVSSLYGGLNAIIAVIKGLESGTVTVNSEPLLFGLFYLIVNMSLVGIKNVFVLIINDAKKKSQGN